MTTTERKTWNAEDQPDPLEPCVGNPAYEAHIEKVISTALGPGKFSYLQTNLAIILDREQREKEGYRKPRTITSAAELDDLPFGSAVQTSDTSDTVVLKCEDGYYRNQSGFTVSVPILWRYGTKPFTVLYEATV